MSLQSAAGAAQICASRSSGLLEETGFVEVDFDLDGECVDAVEEVGVDACEHGERIALCTDIKTCSVAASKPRQIFKSCYYNCLADIAENWEPIASDGCVALSKKSWKNSGSKLGLHHPLFAQGNSARGALTERF